MHRPIKRYEQKGVIYDDKYFERIKYESISMTILRMRYDGYVPRFDIEPDWSLSYDGKNFDYLLSVYGVFVGRKKAQCIQGMAGNMPILFTPKPKSAMPSESQASE